MVSVYQFHSGSAVGDAVTNGMLYIEEILRESGIASAIYVESRDPNLEGKIKLIGEINPRPNDVLLIHHSMGHDMLPFLQDLRCRKILVYHNITPPHFFADEFYRQYSLMGYEQLSTLREMVDASIVDSDYNADDLRQRGFDNVHTIPLLKNFTSCRMAPYNQALQFFETPRHQLLFVGRMAANKGQLDLVRFMAEYRDSFDQPLHLALVGHSSHGEAYAGQVMREIAVAGLADRVTVTGHVSDEDLYGWYRASDAYVSLSEHEGFGVPLVEALAFDLPVVAYNSSAITSTLAGSGIILNAKDPASLAEALAPILMDNRARRGIVQGQRIRLADFSKAKNAALLISLLMPYLGRSEPIKLEGMADDGVPSDREYVIEGPCETSYSLAIVNRCLGLALHNDVHRPVILHPLEGWRDIGWTRLHWRCVPIFVL